jgi:transcription termination factor Rho
VSDGDDLDRQIAELSSPEPLPIPPPSASLESDLETPTAEDVPATPQAAAADVVAVDELEGLPVAASGAAVEEVEPASPLSPEAVATEGTTTFSTSVSDEAAESAHSSPPPSAVALPPSVLEALPAPAPLATESTTKDDLEAAETSAEVGETAARVDEEETQESAFEPVGESRETKEKEVRFSLPY